MPVGEREVDIARNIRMLEWLKAELVSAVGTLLRGAVRGGQEALVDGLAGVLMTTYLLGRRLGISYARMESRLLDRLRAGIADDHEAEQWFGDLSSLLHHLESKR